MSATTTVTYSPPEALKWIQFKSDASKEGASRRLVRSGKTVRQDWKSSVTDVAGAVGAYASTAASSLTHAAKNVARYDLDDTMLTAKTMGKTTKISFEDIQEILLDGDEATIIHSKGNLKIKPIGYVSSGIVKAPLGWRRNGTEVPFATLIEEIAGRAGLRVP
jgi:hypothetical protein